MFVLILTTVAFAAPSSTELSDLPMDPPVGCDTAVPVATVMRFLQDGERRLVQLDEAGLDASGSAAEAALPCIGAVLSPANAAVWHRVMGVRAFSMKDEATARDELRATFALSAGAPLPTNYASEGGTLYTFYQSATAAPAAAARAVNVPDGVDFYVDGTKVEEVPADHAALLQLVDSEGIIRSWTLPSASAIPDLAGEVAAARLARKGAPIVVAETATGPVDPEESTELVRPGDEKVHRRPVGLLIATGSSALLGGGSYALSWYLHGRFGDLDNTPVPVGEVDNLRWQTNASTVAAPVLGVTALGLGIATVVRW